MSSQRNNYLFSTGLVVALLILVNVAAQYFNGFADLTEENRFTLSDSTMDLVKSIDEVVYIRVLLDGEFPAGFKRLKAATLERLDQFRSENPYIEYKLEDPSEGSIEQINERRQGLSEKGITPINLMVRDGNQRTEKLIYPYAIINYAGRENVVNLLEPQTMNQDQDVVLNNSINLLEYKFGNALSKLTSKKKPNVVFAAGHGELGESVTASLEKELKDFYNTGRIYLDSIYQLDQEADVLIIAAPKTKISDKIQLVIDQYIMNGGKVAWLIESFEVNLDSINGKDFYVPKPIEHGLDDMLFKYGVRIKKNLILDLECSQIPQVIGMQGGKAQTELFPWYYHPLSASKISHPIVNGIDRVNFKFPSTIETIDTELGIEQTILLSSSDYSRFQVYPFRINFDILRLAPDPSKFNKGSQPIAVLLEGEFDSYFKNRLSEQQQDALEKIGSEFKPTSVNTKQVVVSDADFIKNLFNPNTSQISPIGFNKWEQKVYGGNKSFIVNIVEYLVDDYGLLEARAKDYKLRMLDKVKTAQEATKWQMINLVIPILLIWLFAIGYFYFRKRKYTTAA